MFFGDVLAFDTTYRTNAYKKPLVVLVGVNHHHQTVVFCCALLIDESVWTYEWVLETFLDAMMNKKPISIVTDGDKLCVRQLKKYYPIRVINCVHGICNEMHSRICILRTSQAYLQGACSCVGMKKNLKRFDMKWLQIWDLMRIVG